MPFIPHTEEDEALMLKAIGAESIVSLFKEIPRHLWVDALPGIPQGMSEMEVGRLMAARAANTPSFKCFIGAGAYEHHIPSAVWDITMRGEFLTAYTPYQAEASQGSLQLLWEYQTMMASLMGLEVSNASLYDGATALAEAALMANRLQQKSKHQTVWVLQTLHPYYRQVLTSLLAPQEIEICEIPFNEETGIVSLESLETMLVQKGPCSALVISQPNFFGCLEEVNALTDWAHSHGALVIGVVNPIAMAWLKPPGQWGKEGADIACGEGQPLGIPLASGGPYVGFLCSKMKHVRQLPGRLVGRTVDKEGKEGFTLTLQAREQHIRRAKATSNICTNQGLLVTAATIYLSLLGPEGLKRVAQKCYERMQFFLEHLKEIPGVKRLFPSAHFHEIVLQLPISVQEVLKRMAQRKIAAGFSLPENYPMLKNTLLVCLTETKTDEDIVEYLSALKECVSTQVNVSICEES